MNKPFDINQLEKLCESRYGLVLEAACRFAPKADLTRDIVQQTFSVFVHGVRENRWDLQQDINPLLYGIAKKVAMEYWRMERKHSPEALTRLAELLGRQSESSPSEENVSAEREMEKIVALQTCMEKLTPRNRDLLNRHYYDGIKTEELALQNNVKGSAIRQLFCRVRAKLRKCIEQTVLTMK